MPKFNEKHESTHSRTQQILTRMNLKKFTARCRKLWKANAKDGVESSKKRLTEYKSRSMRLTGDFSSEIMKARIQLDDIFKVLKGNC